MRKLEKALPTLALILPLLPWILGGILAVLATGGNWAFWILALIVFVVSSCIGGLLGMILSILSIRRRIGIKRAVTAIVLAVIDLILGYLLLPSFWL